MVPFGDDMDAMRTVFLMAATLSMGLVAGVFTLYAHTIMPGLEKTDDRTFVAAFQAIDRTIINPWFLGGGFFGALVLTGGALLLHAGQLGFPWIAAALASYATTVGVTLVVNVPLNDRIKAAGDPDQVADLAAVRRQFDAPRWTTWNLLRVVMTNAAFGFLAWALILLGRSS
jgi:uncharacterized membrane protein